MTVNSWRFRPGCSNMKLTSPIPKGENRNEPTNLISIADMMDSTVATWRTTMTASNAPMESHPTTNTRAPESTETWRQTHQQLVHGLRISTEYRPLCRCTPCLIVPPMATRDNENNHSSCQLSAHTASRVRHYLHTRLLFWGARNPPLCRIKCDQSSVGSTCVFVKHHCPPRNTGWRSVVYSPKAR